MFLGVAVQNAEQTADQIPLLTFAVHGVGLTKTTRYLAYPQINAVLVQTIPKHYKQLR
jgi:hypothetical protein